MRTVGFAAVAASLFVAGAAQAQSTLTFDASWNETTSGAIVAGGSIAIDYDEIRLPTCRAWHNGNPGWQITAFVKSLPSGQIDEQGIFTYQMTPTGPDYYTWIKTIPEFDIPLGTTSLEIWFRNDSAFDHPCTAWDSNYGANYSFGVSNPALVGGINFMSTWSNETSGTFARGGVLQVTYDTARMQSLIDGASNFFASKYHCYGYGCCSHTPNTTMRVRFHSTGAFQSFPVNDGVADVSIPTDASRIEIYFDSAVSTLVWFCGSGDPPSGGGTDLFYDSNYGNNFVFTIP